MRLVFGSMLPAWAVLAGAVLAGSASGDEADDLVRRPTSESHAAAAVRGKDKKAANSNLLRTSVDQRREPESTADKQTAAIERLCSLDSLRSVPADDEQPAGDSGWSDELANFGRSIKALAARLVTSPLLPLIAVSVIVAAAALGVLSSRATAARKHRELRRLLNTN